MLSPSCAALQMPNSANTAIRFIWYIRNDHQVIKFKLNTWHKCNSQSSWWWNSFEITQQLADFWIGKSWSGSCWLNDILCFEYDSLLYENKLLCSSSEFPLRLSCGSRVMSWGNIQLVKGESYSDQRYTGSTSFQSQSNKKTWDILIRIAHSFVVFWKFGPCLKLEI